MTYVIGNDAPEGKYATKSRVFEASSYAGYKFEITGFAVNSISAAVRVKNIGIAPLYHNAYVTVKGVRSNKSLKGLLPGEEATYTVSGISIADGETPEPSITSDKLLKDVIIPYKANLDGSAKTIEGTVEESGTTAIARNRVNIKHNATNARIVDLKGRAQTNSAKMPKKAYYKLQAQ